MSTRKNEDNYIDSIAFGIPDPSDAHLRVVRLDSNGHPLTDRSVLEILTARHSNGCLYRGQLRRHFRPWPTEDKKGITAQSYILDSMVPSDYRGLEEAINLGKRHDESAVLAYGDSIATARVGLVQAGLHVLALGDGTNSINKWLNDLPGALYKYLMSLAQHTGILSQMADFTRSIEVAHWFASHSWDGLYHDGEGVIYKIEHEHLESAIRVLNSQDLDRGILIEVGFGPHAVPNAISPRPTAQASVTVAGIEVGEVLLYLIGKGAITAYIFQRDLDVCPLNLAEIRPSSDPLASFIEQARSGIWNREWQDSLRSLCLSQMVSTIPDIADPRVRTAVFDGYQALLKL